MSHPFGKTHWGMWSRIFYTPCPNRKIFPPNTEHQAVSSRYNLVLKGQLCWTQSSGTVKPAPWIKGYWAHFKNTNNSHTSNTFLRSEKLQIKVYPKRIPTLVPNKSLKWNILNTTHHTGKEFFLSYRVCKCSFVPQIEYITHGLATTRDIYSFPSWGS
jgi:hypothetical protein